MITRAIHKVKDLNDLDSSVDTLIAFYSNERIYKTHSIFYDGVIFELHFIFMK